MSETIQLSAFDAYSKDSDDFPLMPLKKYRVVTQIKATKGVKHCAYFGVVILDISGKEMGRRIQWVTDFSNRNQKYEVVFAAPVFANSAKIIYRVNKETLRQVECELDLVPIQQLHIDQVIDEDYPYEMGGVPFTFDPSKARLKSTIHEAIWNCYKSIMHRQPTVDEMEMYHEKIATGALNVEELPESLKQSNEYNAYEQNRKDFNLNYFEKRVYSQHGEDGIIDFIFNQIATTNKFCVEFGVENGLQCNTRYLIEMQGWQGLWMDGSNQQELEKKYFQRNGKAPKLSINPIRQEFITAENIESLFKKYDISHEFDLISIDIDYNDYWVWKAITDYRPRVVVIEYNATIPPTESKTVKYDPYGQWDGITNYYGASILAFSKLAKVKGYSLVGCDSFGVNAFFLRNDCLPNWYVQKPIAELYRPPKRGKIIGGKHIGNPASSKIMIEV